MVGNKGVNSGNYGRSNSGIHKRCLTGEQEAHVMALVCSEAPAGQARWTLRLLANQMVQLGYVEGVSHETIRQTLKKMNYSLGNKTAG